MNLHIHRWSPWVYYYPIPITAPYAAKQRKCRRCKKSQVRQI